MNDKNNLKNINEELTEYIEQYIPTIIIGSCSDKDENRINTRCYSLKETPLIENAKKCSFNSAPKIDENLMCCDASFDMGIDTYIGNFKDDESTFQKILFGMIDKRNLKDSDVYNKVHLDRRLFSKIRSDVNYHPSKETVILLAISLELSEDELITLLDSASYSLPQNNHFDLIIRFCFIKHIYDISTINQMLEQFGCKEFNY